MRLEIHGHNEIAIRSRASAFIKFLSHFKSPVTIILLAAAILSGVLGDRTNMLIILSIVMVSVILDFTQEYRAERAAEQLRRRVATTATVLGRQQAGHRRHRAGARRYHRTLGG